MTLESFMPIHQWNCGKKCMKGSLHQRYLFLILLKQDFLHYSTVIGKCSKEPIMITLFSTHMLKNQLNMCQKSIVHKALELKWWARHSSHSTFKCSSHTSGEGGGETVAGRRAGEKAREGLVELECAPNDS